LVQVLLSATLEPLHAFPAVAGLVIDPVSPGQKNIQENAAKAYIQILFRGKIVHFASHPNPSGLSDKHPRHTQPAGSSIWHQDPSQDRMVTVSPTVRYLPVLGPLALSRTLTVGSFTLAVHNLAAVGGCLVADLVAAINLVAVGVLVAGTRVETGMTQASIAATKQMRSR
jgi:hypothetical protein